MFRIKQCVVYPGHGIGYIEKIEKKEVLGVKQKYYVIHMEDKKMRVFLPIEKAEEYGLRPVVTPAGLKKIFSIFRSKKKIKIDKDWKIRYQTFMAMARSKDFRQTAAVLKEMNRRYLKDELSIMERKLMENTLHLMILEIAHVKKIPVDKAEELVRKYLKR